MSGLRTPVVSVIIPVHNGAAYLRKCLEHLRKSTFVDYECIVGDDGSTDDSAGVARSFGVKVVSTPKRSGPAAARNQAAKHARAAILFFIDADVCVQAGTLERVAASFRDDPELDALIGSYDDAPEQQDFLSQYRNLMHCYTHQHSRREACTFWSGCGCIRRDVFEKHSGFDASYERPAIEDIELGYRLKRNNHKIILDPDLQVKHLKAWSFIDLVRTDIFQRGIPWTELILRSGGAPNDLNLQLSQRVSVALVYLLIAIAAAGALYMGVTFILPLLAVLFLLLSAYEAESSWQMNPKLMVCMTILIAAIAGLAYWSDNLWLAPPVLLTYLLLFLRHRYYYTIDRRRRMTGVFCGVYLLFVLLFILTYLPWHPLIFVFVLVFSLVILLNSQFYVFLAGRTGRLLALAAIPFHLLFHFYNGISFAVGLIRHTLRASSKARDEKKASCIANANQRAAL
jgi:glycosyltransferase involved in cell wall biosynthesis